MIATRVRARGRGTKMKIGFKFCRGCGAETNCADLVSGYCPNCAKVHVARLSEYQRQYEAAVAAGDASASGKIAALISRYEQSERLRLKDARRVQ